ncbi:hypothetical protein T492DRAFT_847601 [Pavlovales sp. CCMP2436]|nr:hypothetical protein T492DRAFT_847601 [Pavlovales sp. CCMP2436]
MSPRRRGRVMIAAAVALVSVVVVPVSAEGWSPLSFLMGHSVPADSGNSSDADSGDTNSSDTNSSDTNRSDTAGEASSTTSLLRWKGLHIIRPIIPSPRPPPPPRPPASPPAPPQPPPDLDRKRAPPPPPLVHGPADSLPLPPSQNSFFCGDRHWPASMLSTSPRDCQAAVAALQRSRKDGSLLVYFAWSEGLGYCFGCSRDEVADAQPDSRFVLYETFAPEFRVGSADASAGSTSCYDLLHWLSPGLLGCAELEERGLCLAGLVVDVRVNGGWRGGYPERSCCACGGGQPSERSSSPPLSPPVPRRSGDGGACRDLPSNARGGASGERALLWTEPSGLGCDVYEDQAWCADAHISRFAGPAHNNPEVHCCACGGGSREDEQAIRAALPPVEHLGCVELGSDLNELPLMLQSARVFSFAVVDLGQIAGAKRHRGRTAVSLCSEICVAFTYFAVGPHTKGGGTECVCYSLDSTIVPLTRDCNLEGGDPTSIHVFAHDPRPVQNLLGKEDGAMGGGSFFTGLGAAERAERALARTRERIAAGPALFAGQRLSEQRRAPWLAVEGARDALATQQPVPRASLRPPLLGGAALLVLAAAAALGTARARNRLARRRRSAVGSGGECTVGASRADPLQLL